MPVSVHRLLPRAARLTVRRTLAALYRTIFKPRRRLCWLLTITVLVMMTVVPMIISILPSLRALVSGRHMGHGQSGGQQREVTHLFTFRADEDQQPSAVTLLPVRGPGGPRDTVDRRRVPRPLHHQEGSHGLAPGRPPLTPKDADDDVAQKRQHPELLPPADADDLAGGRRPPRLQDDTETGRRLPGRHIPEDGHANVRDMSIGRGLQRPAEDSQAVRGDDLLYLLQTETTQPTASRVGLQDRGHPPRNESEGHCTPHHHVFFAKVHKAGSSTVANILQRYGFARHLNFVLPRKRVHSKSYNYLSLPGQTLTRRHLIPPPRGQGYDMLWNHAIYDSAFFHQVMPADTLFFTILRHPLDQFVSSFEYYGRMDAWMRSILDSNATSNPLSDFLRDHDTYPWMKSPLSFVRNKQAQDLGMTQEHVLNATLRRQYLLQLDRDFHWVMITEYFDESLVMLRRLLCWSVKDVLYIPRNKNPYKKERHFTARDRKQHQRLSQADYDIYQFFLERLKNSLRSKPADFAQEVTYFKALLKAVRRHCGKSSIQGILVVSPSRWNPFRFQVTRSDCRLLQKHELVFMDDLVVAAVRRYHHSQQGGW